MNEIKFVDRVKKYFTFLETDHGFKIVKASNSEIRSTTDGVVKYINNNLAILIDSETGYSTVRFFRISDSEKYYLTPIDIHEYLNTNEKEKQLLLSTNPQNQSIASNLFNQKFLLNQPGWKENRGDVQGLEKELESFAKWIQEHAHLCSQGEFVKWSKIYEYKVYRARADRLRRGKDEFGYSEVKDNNGNWTLVKQSIFKDQLEYIEKLKKELND